MRKLAILLLLLCCVSCSGFHAELSTQDAARIDAMNDRLDQLNTELLYLRAEIIASKAELRRIADALEAGRRYLEGDETDD